nr:oligosaccharide flippase family protein [Ruthenibacterium lactatiformans]
MLDRIKSKIKKIPIEVKSATVYTFSTLFSRGLAIITVPIFTRLMTTSQIGIVNLYNSWYSMISAIATLSLTSGGYVVALREYESNRDGYQSSVLSLTSLISLLLVGVYLVNPSLWSKLLGLPSGLIILMLIGFLFAPARDFWLARQRYEYKYKLSGFVMMGSALIASLLSILTVIRLSAVDENLVAEGRLYSNYLIIYGVSAVIWFCTMLKGKTFFNKEYWKLSLSLSLPLVGYSVASQILTVSDRMMISQMVGNSAVGIYSTLYTVSSLSLLVWQAVHSSFVPYIFRNIENGGDGTKRVSSQLMTFYAAVAVLMTFLAPEIVRILATEEYYEAIYIMPPIAAGVFFTSFANLYSDIAVYYKKTKYVMYPAIIAAVSNLILNYIFIKIYGYMAAAYTTLFSYILFALFQGVWAKKICKEHGIESGTIYNDRYMIALAVITTLISLSGILFYGNTILRYGIVILLVVVCAVVGKKVIKNKRVK